MSAQTGLSGGPLRTLSQNRITGVVSPAFRDGPLGRVVDDPRPFFSFAHWAGPLSSGVMAKTFPDFEYENSAFARGATYVAGVDEVGRGPLAGPVVAGAVRLDPGNVPAGLNDSKVIRPALREKLTQQIWDVADVSIGQASVDEIDELNILHASMLAMERAVVGLSVKADHVLVDGNRIPPGLLGRATAIVKGDARSLSISAASIVAKTWRDRLMVDLAQQHPGYGWAKNAGYPTKEHLSALQNLGVTPHHRRSFKPVHNILYQDKSLSD